MKKILYLLLLLLFLFSCDSPTSIIDEEEIKVTIIYNLPVDANGYYRLKMDTTRNQTLHAIDGIISPAIEHKRFEWRSNLYSYFNGVRMASTNERSYTDETGSFRNIIGPILSMRGDTMLLDVQWDSKMEWDTINNYEPDNAYRVKIILD